MRHLRLENPLNIKSVITNNDSSFAKRVHKCPQTLVIASARNTVQYILTQTLSPFEINLILYLKVRSYYVVLWRIYICISLVSYHIAYLNRNYWSGDKTCPQRSLNNVYFTRGRQTRKNSLMGGVGVNLEVLTRQLRNFAHSPRK